MFHQVEGLSVDENANFSALKGVLADFMQHFFERDDLPVASVLPSSPLPSLPLKWISVA